MRSHKYASGILNIFNIITKKLENDMVLLIVICIIVYDKCIGNYIVSSRYIGKINITKNNTV